MDTSNLETNTQTIERLTRELAAANADLAVADGTITMFMNQAKQLQSELSTARAAGAEMREVLRFHAATEDFDDHGCLYKIGTTMMYQHALSSDCGKDYVPQSELEPTKELLAFLSAHTALSVKREPERILTLVNAELARLEALKPK